MGGGWLGRGGHHGPQHNIGNLILRNSAGLEVFFFFFFFSWTWDTSVCSGAQGRYAPRAVSEEGKDWGWEWGRVPSENHGQKKIPGISAVVLGHSHPGI